jgi:hypothetical protein
MRLVAHENHFAGKGSPSSSLLIRQSIVTPPVRKNASRPSITSLQPADVSPRTFRSQEQHRIRMVINRTKVGSSRLQQQKQLMQKVLARHLKETSSRLECQQVNKLVDGHPAAANVSPSLVFMPSHVSTASRSKQQPPRINKRHLQGRQCPNCCSAAAPASSEFRSQSKSVFKGVARASSCCLEFPSTCQLRANFFGS